MKIPEEKFQTGDILLFHHQREYNTPWHIIMSIFNAGIDWVTGSKFSHVGIIIRDPPFWDDTHKPLKGLYVLESGYEEFPDAEDHEYKLGVELETLDNVLKRWNGTIYWRQLTCQRDEEFQNTLCQSHSVVHNRYYDLIPTDWINAALELNLPPRQRTQTFWCSALVGYLYTKWGFLPKNTSWTLLAPKQFSTEPQSKDEQLHFQNCTLAKEVEIK